jgi:hypothetical protein
VVVALSAESFRRWRSRPDHKRAHKGIPKGLKLDPTFTLIRTLDRLSDPGNSLRSDGVRDSATVISEFLTRSAVALANTLTETGS